MKLIDTNCANCRFCVVMTPEDGHCRRNPPLVLDDSRSTYPVVSTKWWCGEYRRSWWRWVKRGR